MRQSTRTRLIYGVGVVAVAVMASCSMAPFAQDFVKSITPEAGPSVCDDADPACRIYGTLAVFRLTFALAVYHLWLALVLVRVRSSEDPRAAYHNRHWALKAVLLGGLVVGFWFVPNDFYIGYGYAALSGAFVFALVQGFCLLGVADKVNGAFVARMEESEGRGPFVALLLLTLTAFGAALALASLVLAYYRAPLPGYHTAACAINSFFGAFAIATAAAVAVLSVLPVVQAHRPKMGLFHAAVVAFYMAFLTWLAASGEPHEIYPCDAFPSDGAAQTLSLVVGGVFLGLAIWYLMFLHGDAAAAAGGEAERLSLAMPSISEPGLGGGGAAAAGDDERYGVAYSYSSFHLMLASSALYLSMLITNWNLLGRAALGQLVEEQTVAAVWLKWSAATGTVLLYVWMLFAPILFPDRDFGG